MLFLIAAIVIQSSADFRLATPVSPTMPGWVVSGSTVVGI